MTSTATVIFTASAPKVEAHIYGSVVKPEKAESTHIQVRLDKSQKVKVIVYNQRGQVVKTLVDELKNAGTFDAVWQGVNRHGQVVASGIYVVYIKTDTFQAKKRVVVIR